MSHEILQTMTPETANGRGSVPLVSDAVRATPVGNPPPSASDGASAANDAAGTATDAAGQVTGPSMCMRATLAALGF